MPDQGRAGEVTTWEHVTGDVTRTLPRWEWWILWGCTLSSAVTGVIRVLTWVIR